MLSKSADNRGRGRRRWRRGVTFTEVMFAVVILGIGFIMLAGMFPVAIMQTQSNVEETAGAVLAESASRYLQQALGDASLLPPTGVVVRALGDSAGIPDARWQRVAGNLICAGDPRYAWTVLYRRPAGQRFAQVIIIVLQARNRPAFDARDTVALGGNAPNLMPRLVRVNRLARDPDGVDRVTFESAYPFLDVGAFVVIAAGDHAGRVYRLGNGGGSVFELAPGEGLSGGDSNIESTVDAYVVGRGYEDPSAANPVFSGPAMDVSAYTTFIVVK